MRYLSVFVFIFLNIYCVFMPVSAKAQTSIGHTNPQDTANLLDYRLPNWSYRVWDINVDFTRKHTKHDNDGSIFTTNRFTSNLRSDFFQSWESEPRNINIQVFFVGQYLRYLRSSESHEDFWRDFNGNYEVRGEIRQFVGKSPFSLLLGGVTQLQYREYKVDSISYPHHEDDISSIKYSRNFDHIIDLGLGWGRVRDVVPLIRAQRLSERLAALGRPTLTASQVQKIAVVLATQHGYRAVFDRENRHFWSDVLAPMLDPEKPLSPLELYYLTDVINEDVGIRKQGFIVNATYRLGQEELFKSSLRDNVELAPEPTRRNLRYRTPQLTISWFNNLSLNHQIHLEGQINYDWNNHLDSNSQFSGKYFTVAHLWNMADRLNLNTSVNLSEERIISSQSKARACVLYSKLNFYVEDQLSLTTSFLGRYDWSRYDDDSKNFKWSWEYRLGLEYHLDRLIF